MSKPNNYSEEQLLDNPGIPHLSKSYADHEETVPFASYHPSMPLNVVRQRERFLSSLPSSEEFVGAGMRSGPQDQYPVDYKANEYLPSTADCYSPVGHPHDFSLTDPFNPQPSVQHTVTPSGHSITPNNSFDNQQYNISFEAREAGADAGMFGEDMIEYVINPTIHKPPAEPGWAQCKYCGCSFRALSRHIQDVHRKRPIIDCPEDECSRKGSNGFGRLDNLREHLRRVHDKPIPKKCRRKTKKSK